MYRRTPSQTRCPKPLPLSLSFSFLRTRSIASFVSFLPLDPWTMSQAQNFYFLFLEENGGGPCFQFFLKKIFSAKFKQVIILIQYPLWTWVYFGSLPNADLRDLLLAFRSEREVLLKAFLVIFPCPFLLPWTTKGRKTSQSIPYIVPYRTCSEIVWNFHLINYLGLKWKNIFACFPLLNRLINVACLAGVFPFAFTQKGREETHRHRIKRANLAEQKEERKGKEKNSSN